MSQAGLVVLMWVSFIAQGYLFHDGVFRFVPYAFARIRNLASPVGNGRCPWLLARGASWMVALGVVLCLLPGFFQVALMAVLEMNAEDPATVLYSGSGWLIGFFASTFMRRRS